MDLKIKITSGPLAGRTYSIESGMVLGRAETDISINDAKISGRHAKIEKSSAGDLLLIDLGSTNGIKVDGKRVNSVVLAPGLEFQIGNTGCRVELDATHHTVESDIDSPPAIISKTESSVVFFSELCAELVKSTPKDHFKLLPFDPIIKLQIVRGLQAGTVWTFGYGPRDVGLEVLEFILYGEDIPAIAFTITPVGQSAVFSTRHSEKVQLNRKPIKTDKLKQGDVIYLDNTEIEVSFQK